MKCRFEIEVMNDAAGVARIIPTQADTAQKAITESMRYLEDGDEFRVVQVKVEGKRCIKETKMRVEDVVNDGHQHLAR